MAQGCDMSCNFPVGAYRSDGTQTYRPCGMCIGCRLEYSRQWAIRCVHEAQMHRDNCFLTLTYNKENLPDNKSIDKRELVNFIKRLRRKIEPKKIRYFGCGEYGSKYSRPHYHLCVFGYSFPDSKVYRFGAKTKYGNRYKKGNRHSLYTSKMLENIWKKGFCSIGELTFETAGYTARYVMKKMMGPYKDFAYDGLEPEFAIMSRMPGVGKPWIDKYMTDVYPKDFHTINGKKVKPSRYYDSIYKKLNPDEFEEIKKKRILENQKNNNGASIRQYHKERYRIAVTKRLEREYHAN